MRLSRPLGLLAATSALLAAGAFDASALQSGDAEALLREGLNALERNDEEAAVRALRGVLAADPTNEEAYRLCRSLTDDEWLELLTQEGQIELAASRIIERARAGRQDLRSDAGAIRELLGELQAAADDPLRRREIAATLGAKHGEFVVPFTLPALASATERSTLMVAALVQMGHRVVPPLVAALESPEARLRQNIAFVLGEIGDQRAAGSLMALSQSDADAGVRRAAADALGGLFGPDGVPVQSAVERLSLEGVDYALERESVLSPYDYSTVVWRFDGRELVPVETQRAFYAVEIAKRRFMAALRIDPASIEARAGLAMVGTKAAVKAAAIEQAGGNVDAMRGRIDHGHLQALAAGSEALDMALSIALDEGDEAASIGAVRALAHVGGTVGAGLGAALDGGDLRLRGEAAVTVAHLALQGAETPIGRAVQVLGEAAGQEVLRQVLVIDGNDARREAFVASIEALPGTVAIPAADGGTALRLLIEVQRADAILVATELPDLTTDAVLAQIGRRPNLESAGVMLITDAGEDAGDWGDRVDGMLTTASDISTTLRAALDAQATVGQQLANDLAGRAASALHQLSLGGTVDLASAVDGLTVGAQRDVDAVAIPALGALGRIGAVDAMGAVAGVATDGGRTEEVRIAAAGCLAGLFRAGARPSADQFAALAQILVDERSLAVRRAVAGAMGALGGNALAELQVQLLADLDPIAAE